MSYEIHVRRAGKAGTLIFETGSLRVETTCWWDPKVVVDAGDYTGYATRMATKRDGWDGGKRQGIWFGKRVPVNGGTGKSDGIFIHKGTSAAWSDGCIVIVEAQMRRIWDSIHPKEQPNVAVRIVDL
jgi:hypothetical protein